jgi:hypothetical protein
VLDSDAASACELAGFVALAADPGAPAAPAVRLGSSGPSVAVTLAERMPAFAGVEWSTAASCPSWPQISVRLPGGGSVPATLDAPAGDPEPQRVCGGIEVRPLEATVAGVSTFPDATGTGLSPCVAASLRASLRLVPAAQGVIDGTLELADSGVPCVLGGYVGVELTGDGGRLVPLTVEPAGSDAPTVELSPGVGASASLQFESASGMRSPTGAVCADHAQVILPGTTSYLPLGRPQRRLCAGAVTVGALQAA